jgi:hypothetical protein
VGNTLKPLASLLGPGTIGSQPQELIPVVLRLVRPCEFIEGASEMIVHVGKVGHLSQGPLKGSYGGVELP